MLSNVKLVAGIKELSPSAQKASMAAFVGMPVSDVVYYPSYGGYTYLQTKEEGPFGDRRAIFGYKVFTTDSKVKFAVTFPGCNADHFELFEVVEGDTPLTMLKRMLEALKPMFRGEPGPGEVKAYFSIHKDFWTVLPEDSTRAVEIDGTLLDAEKAADFYRVHTSPTECRYAHASQMGDESVMYNGEIYDARCVVDVYHATIPFSTVFVRMPEWEARATYQTVLVDGAHRFVSVEIPGAAFFSKGIDSYTKRIESVVPSEYLFQKGKVDLYAKRDNDETPFLGWELEACTDESKVGRNHIAKEVKARLPFLVMCKSDSSISPEGFETVSVPATLDFWKESDLADTLDAMRAAPYKMRSFKHSSCGFHVHVSRSALSVLDLQKLERFMHNPANRKVMELIAGRPANTYQNYTDSLFTDRAKVLATPPSSGRTMHRSVEGVDYFNYNNDMNEQVDFARIREVYGEPERPAYRLFHSYCGDNVSYASLNTATDGLFDACRTSRQDASLTDWPNNWIPFIKRMCEVSPFFRWKFDQFFDSIRDQLPSITYDPNPAPVGQSRSTVKPWMYAERKTSLPLGRKNSYRAAVNNPRGVTGKGMQRYDVLNTRNENTVEFRLFKGTMNPNTVFRYFEFVDAIVRFVAVTSATNDGLHYEAFVKWLMDDAFNISRYENLTSFLVENKLYKRESIKRRTLPVELPEDGDLNVVAKPKPERKDVVTGPLYSVTTIDAAAVAAVPPVEAPSPGLQYLEDYEETEEDDSNDYDCGDPDCEDCNPSYGY